jgi:hypothetical protein
MASEKAPKEKKSPRQILFPFMVGMGILVASWGYWPNFLAFFVEKYFKNFHAAIAPMFILSLYLIALLLLVFVLARLIGRFFIFLGTFMPLAIFIGLNEWNAYEKTVKFIDLNGVLTLLYNIYSKRNW